MKIVYSNEVLNAIREKKPIVALESTIITHGMPYPSNVEMAVEVENKVRENNSIPATIAIINGIIHVGLEKEELEYLAKASAIKVSKRDLGYVLANKLTGGTTVSGTIIICKLANIKVFATGGIGGVHKKANETFDISRDLKELGESNICVVCAGPKSILDLGLTMEYLETEGVEVLGYKTNILPAFYTKYSNFKTTYSVENELEIANILNEKWSVTNGGVLVANPIPNEFSLDYNYIEKEINIALDLAEKENIKAKDLTPYLLDKIVKLTEGKSLKSNIELVYNNAKVASKIAFELSKLQK